MPLMIDPLGGDDELNAVATEIHLLDHDGRRVAQVVRYTLDQLYDGQRTGRYRWDQLYKTEKTHCGTLIEINLHREFKFEDGTLLDYRIAGIEVDCKYSQTLGNWMIPPEARGHLCLLAWADDPQSQWSLGIVRITAERLNAGANRDQKATLNARGREAICWLFKDKHFPPNVLLQLDRAIVDRIMSISIFGTRRVNELFRSTLGMRVSRTAVATVDRGDDFMKRIRANGGARTALRPEGIIILGEYQKHREIARALGVSEPGPGESVPVRVVPVKAGEAKAAKIDRSYWKAAKANDPVCCAPILPKV